MSGATKAVWKWAALALWMVGMSAHADGGIAERSPDLAGAKAAMVNGFDSGEAPLQRQPFHWCDLGLVFVAKASDKAAPDVAALKAKVVDMCAVELGTYRNKGPIYQADAFHAADYFTRQDWAKAYHADVLKMVDEYKGAKAFWSYGTFSVGHYDPAKDAFPVSFSAACPTWSPLTGNGGDPTFMSVCWEAQTVQAQMGREEARAFEQGLSNPHFYLFGRVYWEPTIVKEGGGLNSWKIKAKVVGAEVFYSAPAPGIGLQQRGARVLALGNVPQ